MGRATIGALSLLSLWLAACTSSVDAALERTVVREVDEPLPVLSGKDLDGDQVSTEDFDGQVLVINVWASWCAPCEEEQPQLVELSEDYADDGVAFLGINHADQEAQAERFVERFAVPYPSLADPSGRFAAALGYVGLPDTYVVDRDGRVRWEVNGPTDREQLGSLIDDVLGA